MYIFTKKSKNAKHQVKKENTRTHPHKALKNTSKRLGAPPPT